MYTSRKKEVTSFDWTESLWQQNTSESGQKLRAVYSCCRHHQAHLQADQVLGHLHTEHPQRFDYTHIKIKTQYRSLTQHELYTCL